MFENKVKNLIAFNSVTTYGWVSPSKLEKIEYLEMRFNRFITKHSIKYDRPLNNVFIIGYMNHHGYGSLTNRQHNILQFIYLTINKENTTNVLLMENSFDIEISSNNINEDKLHQFTFRNIIKKYESLKENSIVMSKHKRLYNIEHLT